MKKNLVSVIIPCFNSENYLAQTITSVLEQTYQKIEIIVVDDGSTDNTKDIVRNFSRDIKYIYQNNKGPSAARNNGARASMGEYLQFLDSDDILLPEKIRKQMKYLNENDQAEIVFSENRYFYDDNYKDAIEESWRKHKIRRDYVEALAVTCVFAIHSILIKRKLFDKSGGFPEHLYWGGEDWEFWMKIALMGTSFHFVPGVESLYRIHKDQKTNERKEIVSWEAPLMYEFKEMFKKYGVKNTRRWYALSLGFTNQARHLCLIGQYAKSRELLKDAQGIVPKQDANADMESFAVPEGEFDIYIIFLIWARDFYDKGMTNEAFMLCERSLSVKGIEEKIECLIGKEEVKMSTLAIANIITIYGYNFGIPRLIELAAKICISIRDELGSNVNMYLLAEALAGNSKWELYEYIQNLIIDKDKYSLGPHIKLTERYLLSRQFSKMIKQIYKLFLTMSKRIWHGLNLFID